MRSVLDPEGAHLAALCRLADFRDQRVLELGCGDGRLTLGIAPVAASVLAFDPDAEVLVCPICFNSKKLDEAQLADNARLAGATPLWQWIGEGAATVFSY